MDMKFKVRIVGKRRKGEENIKWWKLRDKQEWFREIVLRALQTRGQIKSAEEMWSGAATILRKIEFTIIKGQNDITKINTNYFRERQRRQ